MEKTELEKFASWFHQDFGVLFESIEEGTNAYLDTLPSRRKKELVAEIKKLLNDDSGKENKGLKNAWLRLGAQWWNREKSPKMLKELIAKQ